MNPLMIGPDGLVGAATRREMTHLAHCLDRDVKSSPGKVAKQNVTNSTLPRQKASVMGRCPLCSTQVREDRLQKHISSKCPKRPALSSQLASQAIKTISRPTLSPRSS